MEYYETKHMPMVAGFLGSNYQSAIGPNIDKIRADFSNYTNVAPVILVSEVVR